MKRCSQCQQVYSDDNLNFCLSDGAALVAVYNSSEETVAIASPSVQQLANQPTRLLAQQPSVQPPSQQEQQPVPIVRQGVSPVFAYLSIGLIALIAGGAIVGWMKSGSGGGQQLPPGNIVVQQKNEPANNVAGGPLTIQSQNSNTAVKPVGKSNIQVVQSPDPKPDPAAPLTADVVRGVLAAWERAQESKNFASYQACYDSSFVGVKTIKNGGSQTLGYDGWMADRRRMIKNAVNLDLDISNLKITVDGDTATAEFDQYYRSLRYSDWGPKVITVKMGPAGAKIVREELKASNPL